MSTATINRTATSSLGRLFGAALAAGAVAAVVNVIVYLIASLAFAVPFIVVMGPGQEMKLNAVPFILASIVPALGAAVFYALLRRFTGRAALIFTVVAAIFALLSLGGPLTMPVALGTRLTLALLHLTTAAIITFGLLRYGDRP